MRKVIVSNHTSLDGFIAGSDGKMDRFLWNEETEAYAKELMESLDTILFGRVTYGLMADYWPATASAKEDPIIRRFMNDSRKIVFSTTLEQATWKNTSIMTELSAGGIAQLKEETGKDIVIYGSGNMVGQLTQLGLIDDYHIFVNPVVLGRGKSMFKEVADQRQLVLAEARTFSNGVVLLHYLSGQSA